jgi:hypothetical protein
MSWKMTKEVREARLAGLYADVNPIEIDVLLWMAETCRKESRVASVGMDELAALTGRNRSTMSQAVKGLIAKKCISRPEYGSRGQASKYEIHVAPRNVDTLPVATWSELDHVGSGDQHVGSGDQHVATGNAPRCDPQHIPPANVTIPPSPEGTVALGNAHARDPNVPPDAATELTADEEAQRQLEGLLGSKYFDGKRFEGKP